MKLVWIAQRVDPQTRERIAIVSGSRSYTYLDVHHAIVNMIKMLREKGMQPGHRVVVLPDHNEVAIAFIAAASSIGLQIAMPYNLHDAALPEWKGLMDAIKPDHVVCLKRQFDMVRQLETWCDSVIAIEKLDIRTPKTPKLIVYAPEPVKRFLVLFTSGTTGKPKSISISESLICTRIGSVSTMLRFHSEARLFLSGLMNNTTGIIFSFGSMLHGATLYIPCERIPGDWPQLIDTWGITHIMLRPIALKRFIDGAKWSGARLDSLNVLAYGADAMPRKLLEQAREMLSCDWVQGYGLSETFGPFCWLDEADHKRGVYRENVYCVGKPDETLKVAVDADRGVGEVMIRGSALMEGYLDLATGEVQPLDDWFRTGDYGEFTSSGELVLKGRIANTILSRDGHRIYPEEVENVLNDIPGVEAALLLHRPGETALSSRPVACIYGSLAENDEDEIRRIVVERLEVNLSREKWPEFIYASKEPFPKNENDKFCKAEVQKMIDSRALIVLSQYEKDI